MREREKDKREVASERVTQKMHLSTAMESHSLNSSSSKAGTTNCSLFNNCYVLVVVANNCLPQLHVHVHHVPVTTKTKDALLELTSKTR